MYILDDEEADEVKPKKKTKKLTPEEEKLEKAKADADEKNMYWAPILLLFPLGPVCVALTTVVFGGVIINASPDSCNAHLKTFMQGAVGLSYILILFYAYCWIGPRPIKKLKTLRIFYAIYGIICILWWGVYGSLQAATATSSGLNSCLQTAPALFVFSQYQVTMFWLLFVFFLCFAIKEMRMHWLASDHVKLEKQKAADEVKRKKIEEEEKAQAAAAEAARIENEKRAAEEKANAERDRLYQNNDEDTEENPAIDPASDGHFDAKEGVEDADGDEDDEEEEEDEDAVGEGEDETPQDG
ncbi:unnamed protein product [Aphanomyces euteiches]|uniref:Uncharacterized protein n=1 Tax=Aphanomyces euteiches TaxID=100861 RepID=A0A6G0X947_9STRA|nr:hypothetical protein Ae201684_007539 [Aphanomyces euteiches]KAH9100757.1 hypothetical protein Ae201684P_006951 [Aphanomyces euteiches]KAH9132075.1 hypothetical protein AeRB84_021437 [Aphanomyces euteiches]